MSHQGRQHHSRLQASKERIERQAGAVRGLCLPKNYSFLIARVIFTYPVLAVWSLVALLRLLLVQPCPKKPEAGKPTRILYVAHEAELNGAPRSLLGLLGALDRACVEAVVVSPAPGPFVERVAALGLPCIVAPVSQLLAQQFSVRSLEKLFKSPIGSLALVRLIQDLDIDLVHTNSMVVADGAFAAARCNRPHVWHFREAIFYPRLARIQGGLMKRLDSRFATVSEHSKNKLVGLGLPGSRITVVPNPVRIPDALSGVQRAALREELKIPPDAVVIGCAGRIHADKGQDLLVEAFIQVVRNEPGLNLFLLLIGSVDGSFGAMLMERLAAAGLQGKVRMPGFRLDVEAVMQVMDVHVTPSRWEEPLARVSLEAAVSGVPSIVSDRGGLPETISEVDADLVYPAEDAAALARSLLRLLRDANLRKHIAQSGREVVSEKHAPAKHVARMMEIYEEAMREAGATVCEPRQSDSEKRMSGV